MIHYEMFPSDALKVGLIKIWLEVIVTKCFLVHYVPGTTISLKRFLLVFAVIMQKSYRIRIVRKSSHVWMALRLCFEWDTVPFDKSGFLLSFADSGKRCAVCGKLRN